MSENKNDPKKTVNLLYTQYLASKDEVEREEERLRLTKTEE